MITKESIMEATLKMLAQNGIKGSTTRQLAEAAGINEATIFKKFKSKENLIHTTLEFQFEMMQEEIDRFFERDFEDSHCFLKESSEFILALYDKYQAFMVISVKEMGSKDMEFINPTIIEYLYIKVEGKIKQFMGEKANSAQSETISLVLNSVILLTMVERVNDTIYARPPKITINADLLTDVLGKLMK
ncbi:TetR/AcrR family transcriptional regulator [Listeria fleischmannii]|uniref:TetR/AcrR family transcriptional regulator n=2 Tax=Listeria fleischmannii TaxID=1069827 RepID=A0A841YCY8_9LIST|nr:TetR/AcrR family transcriptional regulator [Listeria fleischmannii]EIA21240.1 TetR family transcriptional regulator [Listeria fleischmannii subsp. coloradonensis]MBC1398027.1 TetR/AcrR family transcriptional regulator [Listeria fleischmannii]MBC1417867.1 TetR/AcrR family transcriptional regulator [Listeria fleischmannii]MBC1426088.1 TetR/AcrR family transcriptional regulator [Listeria fleischmannii]STY34360.1 putative DNA-binding transcriptional regulator [Listeria fleischmannii subsp. colo